MAQVGTDRGVSLGSEAALEGVVASGGAAEDLPPVGNDLEALGSSLALLDLLDGTGDLDRRLDSEVEGVERLDQVASEDDLGKRAGAVTEDNEEVGLLGTEAVNPATEADALADLLRQLIRLDLKVSLSSRRICSCAKCTL